jgi:hypothetical protein
MIHYCPGARRISCVGHRGSDSVADFDVVCRRQGEPARLVAQLSLSEFQAHTTLILAMNAFLCW